MALQYPGRPSIPQYESSLAAFMPAFEAGQKERRDADAFDAAAKAFGGPSGATPQPQTALEKLMGMFGGGQQQGPYTRPQPTPQWAPAPTDIPEGSWETIASIPTSGVSPAIPQGYLASARASESGGNDMAANPNSSALGRYQFLDSTWRGLMEQYPGLGLTADGRTDPAQQERAMAQFTQDNARALAGAGIPVDPGTLYAAHFLGAGGAQKALTADPATPMSALVDPGVIEANPQLAQMTAGDFAQWAQGKGGSPNGGYRPPMRDVGAGQGTPFQMDEGTMRTLLASEATRPLAISLIQAQQETQASQGRFVTEQGEDGSIWQRDTLTGERKVLQEPGAELDAEYKRAQIAALTAKPPVTPTDDQREYSQAVEQGYEGTLQDWIAAKPKSGTTVNVVTGDQDGALNKALSTKEGEAWSGYKDSAAVSASNAQDFEILAELLTLAPQGPITGRFADMFKGVNAAGDAVNSIVKRIAPTLRAPGSGATSDIEYDGMLRSLPSLVNAPEANSMILSIMQAKAQINMERGRIVTAYQNEEMSIAEARAAMDALNSQSIMTPEMKRALIGLGSDGDAGGMAPEVGEVVDGYRYEGGDPASPTSWTKVN